ncbi:hypothetical protein OG427_07000 [Streptomyces sp. NBC_00133]|uniref:hypothetical protein n=1 Tax=Streptomyces sp. NBC_00133 TaxID=2903624 RepID=UPI00324C3C27
MDYWPYPSAEADRIDPFDSERTETQYVIFGGHRPTYAFTDPDEIWYDMNLSTWIPWGYKILRMAQKVAILRHGDLVREWHVLHRDPRIDPPEPPPGTTLYLDNWRRSVCGYHVLTTPTAMTAPADAYDYTAAMAMAATASHREGRTLVVYMYDARDWH